MNLKSRKTTSTLSGMVIAAICDVVPFCQLLFRVPQPCAMYYNNYSLAIGVKENVFSYVWNCMIKCYTAILIRLSLSLLVLHCRRIIEVFCGRYEKSKQTNFANVTVQLSWKQPLSLKWNSILNHAKQFQHLFIHSVSCCLESLSRVVCTTIDTIVSFLSKPVLEQASALWGWYQSLCNQQ